MDDIRIPCIVWLQGDPPPDLSGISDPIRIPFTLRARHTGPTDVSTDNGPMGSGALTEAQSGTWGDARSHHEKPRRLSSGIELVASTTIPDHAARILGYDRIIFGGMIHRFKRFYGLAPNDNLVFDGDGGVSFEGAFIGSIHDFEP